nr:hypothetical protein [Lachnospiraceae bacterium]
MKAIVLSKQNGISALLLEDGTTEYRKTNAEIGSRINVEDTAGSKKISKLSKWAATAAAAAVMVLGGGYYTTAMAVSYVSVDVNPSIEYSLNRLDHVIEARALNE